MKRESEKKRRAKIKADPIAHQIYCQKERDRFRKRKEEEKILPRDKLTAKNKRSLKKKQREWTRASRLKKQKINEEITNKSVNENQSQRGQLQLKKESIKREGNVIMIMESFHQKY